MANEKGISANLKNMTANKLLDIVNDKAQPAKLRAAADRELSTRSMGADETSSKMNKGGSPKKKVPAIAISVGMVDAPKNGKGKAAMAKGGMANGRPHMYAGGGSVEDKMNPGLRALAEERPDVVAKMLKK